MLDLAHNPLQALHVEAEAEFQAYDQFQIVATFGEPQAEYAAIRKGAGLIDLPQRGVLVLTGKDRLTFLNNLLTNQTFDKQTKTPLAAGCGVYAFLLNAKTGRVIADLNVIERGDRTLLEVDRRLAAAVKTGLEKYLFSEQVKIDFADLHEMALHGPRAASVITEAAGVSIALPARPGDSIETPIFGVPATIWRDDITGSPGFHLLVPTSHAVEIWKRFALLRTEDPRLGWSKLRPIGWAAFNAARIEAGRPFMGIDFEESMVPAETGAMSRAVSLTKGCYPGQEIVARMHARQQVARQVVGLKFTDDALPIAGAAVTDDSGNVVGGITSSTISPMLSNTAVALALVKRPHHAIGTVLNVAAEGALRRTVVTALPFTTFENPTEAV